MSDTTANSNIDNTKQKLAWVTMAVGFGDKIGQDDNGKPLVLNFAVPVDLSSGFLLKNQQLASNADLEQLVSQADVSVTQLFQVAKLGVYEQLLKERVALHNISADALMKVKTRSSRPQEGNVQIEFPEGRLELSVHNSLRNLQSPRTLITPHSMRLDLVKVALEAISFDKATLLLNQIYRRPSDKQFAKSTLEDTVHRMGLELYHKLIAQKDAFLAQHVLNACQAEDYAAIAEHVLSAEGSALTTATTAASATSHHGCRSFSCRYCDRFCHVYSHHGCRSHACRYCDRFCHAYSHHGCRSHACCYCDRFCHVYSHHGCISISSCCCCYYNLAC